MNIMERLVPVVLSFGALSAHADVVVGTINTLSVDLQTGRAQVQMEGLATFNGGSCSSYWTANAITDVDFMKYLWPMLMMARASNTQVTVVVNGCTGSYPKITAVEVQPRLAN